MSRCVEETVKVYLQLNEAGTKWEVASSSLDGYPLDGVGTSLNCSNGDPDEDHTDCNRRAEAAPELPTAAELLVMLEEVAP
jgi:hypothetical protein